MSTHDEALADQLALMPRKTELHLPPDAVLQGQDAASQPVKEADLAQWMKKGFIVPMDRSELSASANLNPIFDMRDMQGKDVNVLLATGAGTLPGDSPKAELIQTDNGKSFILVNEGYHNWTPSYVRDTLMVPDAMITQRVKQGSLSHPEQFLDKLRQKLPSDAFTQITTQYNQILHLVRLESQEMGQNTPNILIGKEPTNTLTSREGNHYLFIEENQIKAALTSPVAYNILLADAGSALTHSRNGDNTPDGIIRNRDLAQSRQSGLAADLGGAGPLGSRDPGLSAQYLLHNLEAAIPEYTKANPGSPISATQPRYTDLERVSEWSAKQNPSVASPLDRVTALVEEASLMRQYQQTHHVNDLASRKVENQVILTQVMQSMRDKVRMDPEDAGVRPSLDIHTARATVGKQQAVTVESPPTSSKSAFAGIASGQSRVH